MISVLIAEDQSLILGALATLLRMEGDIEVVACAGGGAEALRLAQEKQPDVVVTDIEMPVMTGLELAAALRELQHSARVIIVTTFARPGYVRRALDAGVRGYVLKDAPAPKLAEAIRTVHAGGRAIAPELATQAWGAPDPLTERERRMLRLAGDGLSGTEIARRLYLSEGTVRNYLSEAIAKLGASNRVEAALIARTRGWL